MLSPQDLQQVADDLLELYRKLEDELLASAAKELVRLNLQDAAAAQELAAKLAAEAETCLGEMARQQQETLRSIFEKAADLALKQDAPVYARAGLAVPEQRSVALQQVIEETLQTTQATVSRLANSTPPGLQDAVLRAAEAARQQLQAGTVDAPTAQREAISMLAQEGLRVTHASSGKQERLEPALRRATLSGVNQAELAAQWQLADELKTDLVETSAHIGARNKGDVPENHEMWQGRVFSRSGEHPHYPHFETITGYGTGAGLGGWNCRHSFAPFIEGVSRRRYSDEELARMAERKVSYRGEEMSVYEATQVQRRLERELRSWQRQANALQAAGLDNSAERAMMRQYQAELQRFMAKTELGKLTRAQTAMKPRPQPPLNLENNPEARAAAKKLLAQRTMEEPEITDLVKKTVEDAGGQMGGLNSRLKSEDSLTRKITTEMWRKKVSAEHVASKINDTNRYTGIFESDVLIEKANQVTQELSQKGFELRTLTNSFGKKGPYQGINATFTHPDGRIFELQFHTAESFEIKSKNHGLFEEARITFDKIKKNELERIMTEKWDGFTPPNGWDSLLNYNKKEKK